MRNSYERVLADQPEKQDRNRAVLILTNSDRHDAIFLHDLHTYAHINLLSKSNEFLPSTPFPNHDGCIRKGVSDSRRPEQNKRNQDGKKETNLYPHRR